MSVSLWQNFTGPLNLTGTINQLQVVGPQFHTLIDTVCTGLRWHRAATGTTYLPAGLRIWDYTNSILLYETTAPTDNGLVGWQDHPIAGGINLTAGIIYGCVWFNTAAGKRASYADGASIPAAPSPLVWETNKRRFCTGSSSCMPATQDNLGVYAVDVVVEGDPPPSGQAPTNADIDNALARWFDPNDATRPTSDIKLFPRVAQKWDGAGSELWDYLKTVWDIAGALAEVETPIVKQFLQNLQNWFGGNLADGSSAIKRANGESVLAVADAINALLGPMSAQINTMAAQITAIQASLTGGTLGVADFPFGWVQLDQTSWSDELAWPVAAQLYVVNITTYPEQYSSEDVAGVPWRPRAGWWAPLNGSQPGVRSWLEFEEQQCHQNSIQMAGLLLKCKPGIAGTAQAWYRP